MPTNRLADETSPYLLQHAGNPVDWFPWCPQAFERARETGRPVFLSVGYAACHWCHVMERESFEDGRTAALLNAGFVSIKVDREERPDVDAIYMSAVQAMTGSGGWPMSVFLTPEGRPFYGGTYFPDEERHGLPAFRDVLAAVLGAWHERRDEIEEAASRLARALGGAGAGRVPGALSGMPVSPPARVNTALALESVGAAAASLARSADRVHGGWGHAPKFPQPLAIEFLLGRAAAGDAAALDVATEALDRMAAGGIHDQLGGGFHRYATDARWLVPHFEKMLYDNAQLARAYLHAYELTGEERHRRVAERTLEYVRREMRTADGLFAASQDADTDGTEGATYTWTLDEVEAVLGPGLAPLAVAAWGITRGGNWEGRTILSAVRGPTEAGGALDLAPDEAEERLETARTALLAAREWRPQPARDDKALAAWNGLALAAFADAARILGRDDFRKAAEETVRAILARLRVPDGRLRRSWKDGRAVVNAFLEDHACVAEGLLALYEETFAERWFIAARELVDATMEHFADPQGGFFDTSDDHETLIVRPKHLEDGATPSGNSTMALVLLRLAALTGEGRHRSAAERALALVAEQVREYPLAFARWLSAADLASSDVLEVAIVGDPEHPATRELIRTARARAWPPRVVAISADPASSSVPLLRGRDRVGGRPAAYVCRAFACRRPVTTAAELEAELVSELDAVNRDVSAGRNVAG